MLFLPVDSRYTPKCNNEPEQKPVETPGNDTHPPRRHGDTENGKKQKSIGVRQKL